MSKYGKKVLMDYICGNDITHYDINELENDPEFMIEVIEHTNDKKMCYFCSNKVKNNYEFIKLLINKFGDDLDFICPFVDNYLNKETDETPIIELAILMSNLTKYHNNELYIKYKILLESKYYFHRTEIEVIKQQETNPKVKKEIGMGFLFILELFSNSKIIMDYYAENLIKDIFNENEINIEDLIHEKYNRFEHFEKDGITHYIIKFIECYDKNLSFYGASHPHVLNNLLEEITKIKKRWDYYNATKECKKYNQILDFVHEYMYEYEHECSFLETQILYFIAQELGITNEIKRYDNLSEEYYEFITEESTVDKSKMDFVDLKHYHYIKSTIQKILASDSIDDFYDYIEKKNDNPKEVKKVKFFKRNIKNNSN